MVRNVIVFGVVTALAAAWPPCTTVPASRELVRRVPALSPELVRHLVRDDDRAFRSYCRSVGTSVLRGAIVQLELALDIDSLPAFLASWEAISPYELRVAQGLADEFQCPDYLRDLRLRAGFSPEHRLRVRRVIAEERALAVNGTMPASEKVARCDQFAVAFEALGYPRGSMLAQLTAATEVMELGRVTERLERLQHALAIARSLGETYMTCQILGELGAACRGAGQRDSMLVYYVEARSIALRCRFGDQIGRIMLFMARDQANEGRLGLATDLLMEAQRTCRAFGGGTAELRFLVRAASFFADLGCWEIAERCLRRAPLLLRELGERPAKGASPPVWVLEFERQRAHVLLASGQIDAAGSLVLEIREGLRTATHRTWYAGLLDDWSRGLIEAGRAREALGVADEGLAYCDSLHVPEHAVPLALSRARALYSLGEIDRSMSALDAFEARAKAYADSDDAIAIQAAILRARALDRLGDRPAARALLTQTLARLRAHVRRLDPGPQGYLSLASFQDLRFAKHDIEAIDPREGYRAEMEWRSLSRELGRERRGNVGPQDRPAIESAPLPPEDAWHLVYLVRPGAIVRWVATAGVVRRDTLPIDPRDCALRIGSVVEAMSRSGHEPSRRVPTSLSSDLRDLARVLLPPEILRARGDALPPLVYVSADGPLELLPFESLNLATNGYEALASRFDLAYVRGVVTRFASRAGGPSSILADPLPPPEFARRFPHADSLPASGAEARVVHKAWHDALVFGGSKATKSSVLESWKRAPRIHVAAHLIRDPEIRFVAFIPMAATPGSKFDEDTYLELADVRALDLRGCELVILSGCASGAPYLAARRTGPSLGDGFLDAGAHTVLQTFWEIEDRQAQEFVSRFIREGAVTPDPVRAANAARRAWLRAASGAGAAAQWATWSIALRSIPVPSDAATSDLLLRADPSR